METIRFYFSFRSPYAWFAFHRIRPAIQGLPVQLQCIPVFPPKDFPNDPVAIPAKLSYIVADVERIARAYGLAMQWPREVDTNWMRPHAAYLFAEKREKGDAFALAAYAARYSEGRDLGADDTLTRVASACGLDPRGTVRAADDPALHRRVSEGIKAAFDGGLFGVPTFIYRGETFWGNDRIDWLLRRIREDLGRSVPDLREDPLARPWG
jgi:2-hydroxychromene-2-carboxylate isomerase